VLVVVLDLLSNITPQTHVSQIKNEDEDEDEDEKKLNPKSEIQNPKCMGPPPEIEMFQYILIYSPKPILK
jgi:hypothetical protein